MSGLYPPVSDGSDDYVWPITNFINVGISFILAVAIIVISFCSTCLVKYRNDIARSFVKYLKAGLWLFSGYCFLRLALYGLATAHNVLDLDNGDIIQVTQTYLILVLRLLDVWTEVVAFLMLFRLSVDILFIHGAERADTTIKFRNSHLTFNAESVTKITANVLGVLISTLVLVEAIVLGTAYDKIMGYGEIGYANPSEFADIIYSGTIPEASAQMDLSIIVLLWIFSLLIVVRCFTVFLRCRRDAPIKTPTTYLLVGSILLLLRCTYDFAYHLTNVNSTTGRKKYSWGSYTAITDICFGLFPTFVLLIIIYALGAKKRQGVWSRDRLSAMMADKLGGGQPSEQEIELSPLAHQPSSQPPALSPRTTQAESRETAQPADTAEHDIERQDQSPEPNERQEAQEEEPSSGEQTSFMRGMVPQQTPWGYGYFVPQDPNQPIVPHVPRRALPDNQSAYDYPMQPPPDYAHHVNDAQHNPQHQQNLRTNFGESSRAIRLSLDEEDLGLNHQADGRPPEDSLVQDDMAKK